MHDLVDELTDEQAEYLRDQALFLLDDDYLTPEEEADIAMAKAAMDRGDYVTLEELKAEFGR